MCDLALPGPVLHDSWSATERVDRLSQGSSSGLSLKFRFTASLFGSALPTLVKFFQRHSPMTSVKLRLLPRERLLQTRVFIRRSPQKTLKKMRVKGARGVHALKLQTPELTW